MAYTKIEPIKDYAHLKNVLEYDTQNKKTENKLLVDSYACSSNPVLTAKDFENTVIKGVGNKGNNVAWHLYQSFSPEDNVSPQKAMEIGKELMRKAYPDYKYVIATHVDKEHIHNHIIICSVDFKNFHKLHSNKASLAKIQSISDELCRENGLSIISKNDKNHKQKLKEDIDTAVTKSKNIYDFIFTMQNLGYQVKEEKHNGISNFAFKNDKMKRYMRASSISLDYTKPMIEARIENKSAAKSETRTIYDDKIKKISKRKILQREIDNSIKKAKSYDEFIQDMQRKNFQVKQGVHLALKGENFERFIRSESIRKDNTYYHYSEDMIRFRIEHREEYEKMTEKKIGRIISRDKLYGGLDNWAAGENSNTMGRSHNFIRDVVLYGNDYGVKFNYAIFLQYYKKEKYNLKEMEKDIVSLNTEMRKLLKSINAINEYWKIKPPVAKYLSEIQNGDEEAKRKYNISIIEETKQNYGTLSTTELWKKFNDLKNTKSELQTELCKQRLKLEAYDDVKFNFEHKNGWASLVDGVEQEFFEYLSENGINSFNEFEILWKEELEAEQREAEEKEAQKQEKKEKVIEAVKSIFKFN